MSDASDGFSMLFLAMHASIVTSAIAIAPAIPIRQSNAITIGSAPFMDNISAVEVPRMPVKVAYKCPLKPIVFSSRGCHLLLTGSETVAP